MGWVGISSKSVIFMSRNVTYCSFKTALEHKCSMLSLDRGGLGRDMLLKRQREMKESLKHETARKRVKIEQNQRDSFRRHMSGKFAERQTSSDLYKSQKACEQLDKSKVNPSSFILSNNLFLTLVLRPSNTQTQLWCPVHHPLGHCAIKKHAQKRIYI